MRIGLLPLDERPVNTRYPQMIAAIAGAEVSLPPADALCAFRRPADRERLHEWAQSHAPALDALIVSIDLIGYGGLIPSRTTDDPTPQVIQQVERLRSLPPGLRMYAFNVITRIPNADNNIEEPLYWAEYGTRLHRYSSLMHRATLQPDCLPELERLRDEIPAGIRDDFTRRRLRNHQVNLRLLELAYSGLLDLLVISSDDTSPYGFGTQEKGWLQTWIARLGTTPHLLMYPGADEIGCVLVVRALLARAGRVPRFCVRYAIPHDADRIAPYEDGAVSVTVERQIAALGGVIVPDDESADFVVAVNPPSPLGREYDPDPAQVAHEADYRAEPLARFAGQIAAWIDAGKPVIVCDVAYPNGSDPWLIDALFAQVDLTRLAAYGAWNTAGNTIGTALAQGVASAWAQSAQQRAAQSRFTTHRFVEDWAYQHLVRDEIRDWLEATTGARDTTPQTLVPARDRIEARLGECLARIPRLGELWRVRPGSVRLPWQRTFEVDFDLEPMP